MCPWAGGMQQYYVAVGTAQSKLSTLQDLIVAITSESTCNITIGACCSSRDACDAVICALARVCSFTLFLSAPLLNTRPFKKLPSAWVCAVFSLQSGLLARGHVRGGAGSNSTMLGRRQPPHP